MSAVLGAEAPQFDLPGVDGQNHSLDSYADADVLVLVQSCNHCPYVQAWEGRLSAIASDYADRGVRVVAVNSNDVVSHPEDSFEEMQKRSRRAGLHLRLPLRRAAGGRAGAGGRAHARGLRLRPGPPARYHGAIDDNRDETGVSQQYLRDALDAVLDGNDPAVAETPAVGCTVKWR